MPLAGDEWFCSLVEGKTIGVLGPAPTSHAAVDEVKSCDLVAAPVRLREPERLTVDQDIDIAYFNDFGGKRQVEWKPSGVLVLRGAHLLTRLAGHAVQVRQRPLFSRAGFVGTASAVPDIVFDLLAAGASEVRVAGANFWITDAAPYRLEEVLVGRSEWSGTGTPFSGTLQFSYHPPIESRNFMRTLMLSGKCSIADFGNVMELADLAAAEVLERSWASVRR